MTRDYGEHGQCEANAKSTGDRCGQPATSPAGKCRFHGGESKSGEENGNYKHGAFSKHFRSDLTESEAEALRDGIERLRDPESARDLAIEMAVEAALKYKRSGDTRFQREFRQLCETFNIAPGDELALDLGGIEGAFMQDLRSAHDE